MHTNYNSSIDREAICIPSDPVISEYKTLTRDVAALLIEKDSQGCARLGALHRLSHGAQVAICGSGFNERTVKIRTDEGQYYFVFIDDLQAPSV